MAQLSTNLPYEQMLTKWASQLNPILANIFIFGVITESIALTAATPLTFNHMLGRTPIGWSVIDVTTDTTLWRTQPFNNQTLTLESSADTVIKLRIF